MELLYLWIEQYGNIEKQGFNFSPEWHFDFKPKTNKLTVTKKEALPKDFFGKNISNVTAIVGENGAGKSTLLRFIGNEITSVLSSESNYLVVWHMNNYLLISELSPESSNKQNESKIKVLFSTKENYPHNIEAFPKGKIECYYFNNFLHSTWAFNIIENDISTDSILRSISSKKINNHFLFEFYWMEAINKLGLIKQHNQLLNNTIVSKIKFVELGIKEYPPEKESINQYGQIYNELKFFPYLYRQVISYLFNEAIDQDFDIDEINIELNYLPEHFDKKSRNIQIEVIIQRIIQRIFGQDIWGDINSFFSDYYKIKVESDLNLHELDITPIDERSKIQVIIDSSLCNSIINLYNDHKTLSKIFLTLDFPQLSSGEDALITILSRIIYKKNSLKVNTPIIFLVDEGDLGFHPQWQKQYFQNLMDLFSNKELFPNPVQLIIASHSPFILSDLPKENVIFMEQIKEGKYKGKANVVDGVNKQATFGANIHTLLSDAFFMEGGLIGEFAKGKIEEILKLLQPIVSYKYLKKPEDIEDAIAFFEQLVADDLVDEEEEKLQDLDVTKLETKQSEEFKKIPKGIKGWGKARQHKQHFKLIYDFVKAKKGLEKKKVITNNQFNENNELLLLINKIGEPLVKMKLLELYAEAKAFIEGQEEEAIDTEISLLEQRIEGLRKLKDTKKDAP